MSNSKCICEHGPNGPLAVRRLNLDQHQHEFRCPQYSVVSDEWIDRNYERSEHPFIRAYIDALKEKLESALDDAYELRMQDDI